MASYENLSLSEIQTSLIFSFSCGTTLNTSLSNICKFMFEPTQSCEDMCFTSSSSHVLPFICDGAAFNAPTGHKSIILPDIGELIADVK